MTVIAIPKIIREKFGEEAAEALLEFFAKVTQEAKDNTLELAEGKFEKRLTEEASSIRIEVARTKAEIIKWMFIFYIGQVGALLGILFAFFRK